MTLEEVIKNGNFPPDYQFKALFVELAREHFILKEEMKVLRKQLIRHIKALQEGKEDKAK